MFQNLLIPFLGGATLGLLSVGKLLIQGRILGISGNLRDSLKKLTKADQVDYFKVLHTVGLAAGGLLLAQFVPGSFDVLPSAYTALRAGVGGVLVGTGAGLAGGCTSGHGICGNARLSPRSIVFTLLIMVTGAVSAKFSGTAEALQQSSQTASAARGQTARAGLWLLAGTSITLAMTALLAKRKAGRGRRHPGQGKFATCNSGKLLLLAEVVQGALFALALGVSGMSKPSKVGAFLDVTGPAFDPSLMAVMGGAVLVALPVFLTVSKAQKPGHAISGSSLPQPPAKAIDGRLVGGAVLFGAGWGMSGLCPGPAIVALATRAPQVLVFTSTMLASLVLVP